MNETLKVGIIGAGGIAAKLHLPEMQTVTNARVTLLAGRKQSRLDTLAARYDVPLSTTDYDEVINSPDVNAVIVALPHPLHVEWGLKALDRGLHVLMQKPLSTSLDDADRFVEAAAASNCTVLALPYNNSPPVLAARRLVQQQALGTVSSARARHSHGGPEVYYAGIQQIFGEQPADDLWFFDAAKADAGALFDMGVYSIGRLVSLMGSVTAVTARLTTVAKPTTLEDTAAVLLDFASGALGVAETGWCDAARSGEFSIHGTAGRVMHDFRAEGLQLLRPGSAVDEDAPLLEERIDLAEWPVQNAHQHWAECIRAGKQPELSSAVMARHITEIMLAAQESSRSRRTVEVHSRCGAEPL